MEVTACPGMLFRGHKGSYLRAVLTALYLPCSDSRPVADASRDSLRWWQWWRRWQWFWGCWCCVGVVVLASEVAAELAASTDSLILPVQ